MESIGIQNVRQPDVTLPAMAQRREQKRVVALLALVVFICLRASGTSFAAETEVSATETKQVYFDPGKTSFALLTLAICGTVLVCTELARRGKPFYVRPIAGLKAIEEAVGRATEMGKPMLFVPGLQDVNEIDTVAGLACWEASPEWRPSTTRRWKFPRHEPS